MAITKVTRHNTPAFMAKIAADQDISNETWTKIVLGTEVYDTDGKFASNRFTPTVAGTYNFMLQVSIDDLADQTMLQLKLYKNGSGDATSGSRLRASGTEKHTAWAMWSDISDADDYYEAYVYHEIGGTQELRADMSTIFFGFKLIT